MRIRFISPTPRRRCNASTAGCGAVLKTIFWPIPNTTTCDCVSSQAPFFKRMIRSFMASKSPHDSGKSSLLFTMRRGKMMATGYEGSQAAAIAEFKPKAADGFIKPMFVFGEFKHQQRPLKAIETLAQLSFGRLTERDVPAASDISFLFYSNLYRNPECIEKESICVASQVVGAGFSCQGERRWTRLFRIESSLRNTAIRAFMGFPAARKRS